MSEPTYTPKSEYQCDGSTTHYQGCKCHEARRAEEIAQLRAALEKVTGERNEAQAAANRSCDLGLEWHDELQTSRAACAMMRRALEEIGGPEEFKQMDSISKGGYLDHYNGYCKGEVARDALSHPEGSRLLSAVRKLIDKIDHATWDESVTGHIIVGHHSWERIDKALAELKAALGG